MKKLLIVLCLILCQSLSYAGEGEDKLHHRLGFPTQPTASPRAYWLMELRSAFS